MADAPKKNSGLGCLIVLLIFVGLGILGAATGGDGGGGSGSGGSSVQVVPVGSDGRLVIGEGIPVDLGVDDDAFDALSEARVANDPAGRREVLLSGRGFTVPEGTRVRVIDNGFVKKRVRILEGQYAGEAGWVPFEWVKP